MNKALVVILFAVALDAVGIGLIFPVLPTLLRELTALSEIDLLYGITISVYAAMQFVFSPILGALSDRFGRRPVLMISLLGAGIDYLIMAFTPLFWVIVVTRMIAGLTSANMAVATAYVTDISTPEQRAGRFGMIHAMFGIGFIIGPMIGGMLGEYWVRAPFLAAAALNLGNFLLALFLLPESHPGRRTQFTWRDLNPIKPVAWAIGVRALLPYVLIFGALSFIGQIYGSVWVLFGEEQLDWSPFVIGMSLAAFGFFHAIAQATLPGPAARIFGEKYAAILGFLAEMLSLVVISIFVSGWVIFAVLPIFALGGIGMPALQSLATQTVDEEHQGRLQGVLMSLGSLSAVFGPLFFVGVYAASKVQWPGFVWFVAAIIYAIVIAAMMVRRTQGNVSGTQPG